MGFIEKLIERIREKDMQVIEDCWIDEALKENGYSNKFKDTWGNNSGDQFSRRTLTNNLNKLGFKQDRTVKLWIQDNEKGKEFLASEYIEEMNNLGTDRYYIYDDEYIDEPCIEIKRNINPDLLSELKNVAIEKGISWEQYMDYLVLKQLTKDRPLKKNTKLEMIKESLKESRYSKEEIDYIAKLYEEDSKFNELYICDYLDNFYIEYFKSIGFIEEEIESLKNDKNLGIEALEIYYHYAKENNIKNLKELVELVDLLIEKN